MSESSRKAIVVPVVLEPHSNADSLSLIKVDGYQVVGNTLAWTGVDKAVYIPPETKVKTTRPEFAFLKREGRDTEVVRAKRLRGEWSMGLLAPCPDGYNIGDDAWDYYELEHYEPVEDVDGLHAGNCHPAPKHWANLSKYDLENWRGFKSLFKDKEPVTISQKLNGSNMSCVYSDGEYHVKSRNLWKKDDGSSDFWRALHSSESLKKYLKDNPDHLIQGEMIGKVKGYTYGVTEPTFKAFDIRKPDYHYMDCKDFLKICRDNGIPTSRIFAEDVPYSEAVVLQYVDGEQWMNPKGIREGIVIKCSAERFEYKLNGRLALKLVSNFYLDKSSK